MITRSHPGCHWNCDCGWKLRLLTRINAALGSPKYAALLEEFRTMLLAPRPPKSVPAVIYAERDPEAWEYIALHVPDTIKGTLIEEAERRLRSTRREEGARLTIGDFFHPIASLWLFHAGLLDNTSDETTERIRDRALTLLHRQLMKIPPDPNHTTDSDESVASGEQSNSL